MFLLEAVDIGWVGAGSISGGSIITALVVLWKRSEATNKALIDQHKLRADEAEGRTKELIGVVNKNGEALNAYTAAIDKHAQAMERHAESEVLMAEATDSLARACRAFAEKGNP